MIGWWTILDVIKQIKSARGQLQDGYCSDQLALSLTCIAIIILFIAIVI